MTNRSPYTAHLKGRFLGEAAPQEFMTIRECRAYARKSRRDADICVIKDFAGREVGRHLRDTRGDGYKWYRGAPGEMAPRTCYDHNPIKIGVARRMATWDGPLPAEAREYARAWVSRTETSVLASGAMGHRWWGTLEQQALMEDDAAAADMVAATAALESGIGWDGFWIAYDAVHDTFPWEYRQLLA